MQSTLLKTICCLLIVLLSLPVFAQTVITINSCDTTITDPTGGVFNNNTELTIKSTTGSRLAYNIEYFDPNYSAIYIHNGLSSASPLMTIIGDPFSIPNQLYGGQSTGDAITLKFFGIGVTNLLHFKIRVRCVTTPTNYPVLQPLRNYNASGNIQKTDYDNDGDEDLLIGGKIFRNDSYFDSLFLFERKSNPISGWVNQSVVSADFDGDGFKDVFIAGNSNVFGGVVRPTAAIYRNNGNGSFTLVGPEFFAGAARGGCSIVDFNNDNKPDICYTGSTHYYQNTSRIFKVYLNNGNMNFTDANVTLPGVSGLINTSMSWADSDGDGDKDLLINGHDGNVNIARFFTVNGTAFTNQNIGLVPTSAGPITWADINLDSKPDIVNTGVASPDNLNAIVPELFFNNGGNNFTKVISNLPALALGNSDWADYDGDNDLDVVIDGIKVAPGNGEDAGVYKNNGNGQFSRIGIDGSKGSSAVKWVDFNNDGRLDIIGIEGYYIKNMGADSFKISSFPATSKQYGYTGVLIDDFNNDGMIDVFVAGTLFDVDCNSSSSSTLVLGRIWRLSGVPKFTETADLSAINPYPNTFLPDYYWKWGDFDSDGKPDVILTNQPKSGGGGEYLIIFKNNGNNNFTVAVNTAVTPLPNTPVPAYGREHKQVGIFDIDNDGINELLIPSNNTVYKWVNNQWQLFYSNQVSNNPGLQVNYVDFGDYNNDGFMDVAISGNNAVTLMRNNKNGRLVFDTLCTGYGFHSNGQNYRQVTWADMDNDGDLDLIMTDGILENKNSSFMYVSSQIYQIHAGVGDLNGDGFKDLVNVPELGSIGPMNICYNEQGSMFFNQQSMGTLAHVVNGAWNQSAVCFDVDNDGDIDIVYSGGGGCNTGAAVIVNEGQFTDKLIHVIQPDGGEDFPINTIADIKWNGYQIGNSVKVEVSRDNGITWQIITAGAGSSGSAGNYQWNVTGPVSTNCLVRVTDNINTFYTDKSDAVFRISTPAIPVANAGNDTTICLGNSTIIGSAAITGSTYAWTSSPSGFVSTTANPIVNPIAVTYYYLTVTNGTLVASDTVLVNVSSVTVSLPDSLMACIGRMYNIGLASQPGLSYSWHSIPSGFSSSISNPVITASTNTFYYLTATNISSGCIASDSIYVKADSCGGFNNLIVVYPNPATDVVYLDGLRLSRNWQTLDVYDINKRQVMPTQDIRGRTSFTLPVKDLLNGMNFIRIINLDGGRLMLKFLKN